MEILCTRASLNNFLLCFSVTHFNLLLSSAQQASRGEDVINLAIFRFCGSGLPHNPSRHFYHDYGSFTLLPLQKGINDGSVILHHALEKAEETKGIKPADPILSPHLISYSEVKYALHSTVTQLCFKDLSTKSKSFQPLVEMQLRMSWEG